MSDTTSTLADWERESGEELGGKAPQEVGLILLRVTTAEDR